MGWLKTEEMMLQIVLDCIAKLILNHLVAKFGLRLIKRNKING